MKHKNTAYVDCAALAQNYHTIENIVTRAAENGIASRKPRVICVVKADAYGHGIDAASKALGEAGCSFFAVSSEEEADELRALEQRFGRHPDILILSHIDPDNIGDMLRGDIICTVVSAENAAMLSRAVALYNEENHTSHVLRIHVKLDTGMNRVGFAADEERRAATVAEIIALSQDKNLRLEGIFTHFACADDELMDGKIVGDGYTAMQLRRYRAVLDDLEAAGVNVGLRHAANSAAILCLPEAYFDAVRAGVILYGLMPNGSMNPQFRPVMRFDSTVTHLHRLKKGDCISYGAAYTAERDMTVATVAAGYADGFERRFSGCAVRIGAHMVKQVGRICMDQFMVDVTDCPDVRVGDRVTLFGGDDGAMVNALARRAGTINYEIICGVSKRVTRIVTM